MLTIRKNLEMKNLIWKRGRNLGIGRGWRTMHWPLDLTLDPRDIKVMIYTADKVEFNLIL